MDEQIRKMLRQLKSEINDGRLFVYATHRPTGDKLRFSFSMLKKKDAKRLARGLRAQNFRVNFWSPTNAK